ncbi:MAG TPA: DUF2752 domain-containing protein [Polyangiales bacterium]|nr:DUF2752 domain-containing protein [Polyangiales bacterium]
MTRLAWLGIGSCALAVMITARLLTPDPSGHGTHLALGLPPCGFLSWTGLPCPTCGLTTAFALLARGEILGALRVHPMSVPLFLACVFASVTAATGVVRGDSVRARVDALRADRWSLLLVVSLLTTWLATLTSRL